MKAMERLEEYTVSLREMDVAAIIGGDRAFRIRAGRYRIIFAVDKDESIVFVTHLDTRSRVY